jgi:hypothetical protein
VVLVLSGSVKRNLGGNDAILIGSAIFIGSERESMCVVEGELKAVEKAVKSLLH